MIPIFFTVNECALCGGKNTIDAYSSNNKLITEEDGISINKVICSRCNNEYILKWDLSTGDFIPVDKLHINDFQNNFCNNL